MTSASMPNRTSEALIEVHELQQPNEHTECDRGDQQPDVPNAATSITPLEITGLVKLKLCSASFCFLNAGINDGSLGALIPYVLRTYNHSTGWMAIPYAVAFFGWLIAAIFGGYARPTLGTGGVIIVGAALQFLAQVLRFWVPPFGLFSATFFIVALGQAFQDTQANTFVSTIKSAHRWLGMIHASYALGCLVGPLIATAIASNFKDHWASFYYVPMGLGFINLLLCTYAFRDETATYQRMRSGSASISVSVPRSSTTALYELKSTARQKPIWLLSAFLALYLGAAITAGGWVVEYLHVARGGPLSRVGYISSAFYGGLALGRLVLAEPTFRFGEKRMLLAYTLVSLVLQIVFWRVPNIVVDAVMVSLMGFFLGPAFATAVSVGSKVMPVELRAPGLGKCF